MALYWKLRTIKNPLHRIHVSQRLRALRQQMKAEVTDLTSEHDLRLATWNLMHFGNGGAYWRQTDALLYISEIIDHFDLVALQEVNSSIEQLKDLMKNYLGPEWDYIVTDTTEGSKGNNERMAFVYRKGKVEFSRLAGEIVLPAAAGIATAAGQENIWPFGQHRQFARTPFMVGFRCGWFHFKLCTVHIYFGTNPDRPEGMSEADYDQVKGRYMDIRRTEISEIAKFMSDRQKTERRRELALLRAKKWDTDQSEANYILLGDFNVVSPDHETMKALTDHGFVAPPNMRELPVTLGKAVGYYDQIVHKIADKRIKHSVSGTVDFRKSVFRRVEDPDHYIDVVEDEYVLGKSKKTSRTRKSMRTYFNRYRFKNQISDHKLLWSAFSVDLADRYLERIEKDAEAERG